MANVEPNEYMLKGGNITVNYLTSGFQGQPTLGYNDGQQTKNFSGGAIRVTPTEIGKLVSVTTVPSVDANHTLFSVLLPEIQLADNKQTQSFKTAGIVTNQKGPDSVPQTGAGETYDIIHMHGTARVVMTALGAETATGAKA